MNQTMRILLFFVLPIIAPLFLTPELFGDAGLAAFIMIIVALNLLGAVFTARGSSWALTLIIFLQGLNVIIRLMMFWPHFTTLDGTIDFGFVLTSLISMAISTYLVLRLDKVDVRVQMVR